MEAVCKCCSGNRKRRGECVTQQVSGKCKLFLLCTETFKNCPHLSDLIRRDLRSISSDFGIPELKDSGTQVVLLSF